MKLLTAICVATVFNVGPSLSAQSGAMDKDQMDKKGMMQDGQMTVSGCVAAGNAPGQYMLTNAMMMGDMMNKAMMDKDKMKEPGMTVGYMMSYELVGGDLKAHMGHKVEVTGTMSKMDMDRMGKMDKMTRMERDKMMSEKDMKPMRLNVKSIKMDSANCS